ncbi:MAG TPA: hypothetical protein VFB45_27605 [Pseudolabrys sp.]|nr:hypothetical protein [Pseudolabrys sp.]
MLGPVECSLAGGAATARQSPAASARALVPVAPAESTTRTGANYRPANFLTHLLAIREQAPQWRTHRRARPDEAIAAYSAAAARPARQGAAFSADY